MTVAELLKILKDAPPYAEVTTHETGAEFNVDRGIRSATVGRSWVELQLEALPVRLGTPPPD